MSQENGCIICDQCNEFIHSGVAHIRAPGTDHISHYHRVKCYYDYCRKKHMMKMKSLQEVIELPKAIEQKNRFRFLDI